MSIKSLKDKILKTFENVISSFNLTQKVIFIIGLSGVIVATIGMLSSISVQLGYRDPARGGVLTEGMIGSPRFINPVIATSNNDRALSSLIYSGLVKEDSQGNIILDLAKDISSNEDNTVYTATLRDDIFFHDGKKITTEDVAFTISLVKNTQTKSPFFNKFYGVETSIISEKEISFNLVQPYTYFPKSLNVGILPKHIWEKYSTEQMSYAKENIHPIGSGPFKVTEIKYTKNKIPKKYILTSFKKYYPSIPFVKKYKISFFSNEEEMLKSLNKKRIDLIGTFYTDRNKNIKTPFEIEMKTGRLFGLFINLEKESLISKDSAIRRSINIWIDRQTIINEVLGGYGTVTEKSIPAIFLPKDTNNNLTAGITTEKRNQAENLLDLSGWKVNPETGTREKNGQMLEINITTSNSFELEKATQIIKNQLKDLGILVTISTYPQSVLEQNIIPKREYDILLFGQILQNETDLYAFWHSTQKEHPGINITNYQNSEIDKLLEDSLIEPDDDKKKAFYQKISDQLENDLPIIFLYSPDYIIKSNKKIIGIENDSFIAEPSKRYQEIDKWHLYTQNIWKF